MASASSFSYMTQNLKNLFLDASKIEGAVRAFPGAHTITPKPGERFDEYLIQTQGQEEALLQVYHRNDGMFTLMSTVGKNQPLSLQVAMHVAASCKRIAYEQRPLSIEHIGEAEWKFLLDHLKDYGFEVIQGAVPHGERYNVRKGPRDQVNLNRYNRNGKFLMQGKAREVYSTVVDILSEQLPDKRELVEAQLKTYNVQEVKVETLFAELRQHAPSAMNLLGETGSAIISPALALAKLDIELPDYSCIAYHSLRGLEVYMKSIMAKNNHAVTNQAGFGRCMDASGIRLLANIRGSMTTEEAVAVEEGYAFLKADRNPLFHADANPEMSRILPDKTDATKIMHSVLHLIETTAAAIPAHAR